MRKIVIFACICLFLMQIQAFGQTHNAVPLGDPIYHIIETAQMRGLLNLLPVVKPYSRQLILELIDEMLHGRELSENIDKAETVTEGENGETEESENAAEEKKEKKVMGALSQAEREILLRHRARLSPERGKLDLVRGTISGHRMFRNIYLSYEFGFGMDFTFSGAYYSTAGGYQYSPGDDLSFQGANHVSSGDFKYAFEAGAPFLSFTGDLGKSNSYGLTLIGRVVKNPREKLGMGHNYYDVYDPALERQVTVYTEPLAYFPYTYKKRWDGFVFPIGDLSSGGMTNWPYGLSLGYTMFGELSGSFLDGIVRYRFARIDREWIGMTRGSSLILNESAQPFFGFELTITPFKWFSISSLTGILEYHDAIRGHNDWGGQTVSQVQQNAFSIVMLELNYKSYFHIDLGANAVWPKRLELGYLFPFMVNFLYQNNVGDFDNMALFLNLMGNYPGIGKVWFSAYLEEMNIASSEIFKRDRTMYAFQLGTSVHIPWLPFASFTFIYTKVEPYNYTHTRETKPWYGDLLMETNYVNAGRSLGHYLPPNSDEFLLRLQTMPFSQTSFALQYQLIRHGADYGNRAVDGSHLWSELDPLDRNRLYKYFLGDGAYEWMHIVKLRGEYSFADRKWPVKFFAEVGFVYSYFTDIDGPVNSNTGAEPYRRVNTPQYPNRLYFIFTLGITLFPK